MLGATIQVLLIEDDEIYVEALLRGFKEYKIDNPVTVVTDGMEALDVLRGTNGQVRLPRPYVILLDLNLPRTNGIELLHLLREDPELSPSVVFVLTTSQDKQDLRAAYNAHVAGYIVKQRAAEGFLDLPDLMQKYWRVVAFPPDT